MDLQLINQLIATVNASNLRSFEVEENGFRLRLENNPHVISGPCTPPAAIPPQTTATAAAPVQLAGAMQTPAAEPTEQAQDEDCFTFVKAPLVGIYCPLTALGKENLKPGDKITAGSIVCAIEAMKLINEVKCNTDGEFVEALVQEGEEVEFGQPLLKLRKA